jgi:hypothetical protein
VTSPRLLVASLLVNTGGAGVITNRAGVIAAPGAGFRLRLWAVHLATLQTFSGVLWMEVQDSTGAVLGNLMATAGGQADHLDYPGGLALAENRGVQSRDASSVAAQGLRATLLYTTEQLT